MPTLLSLLLTYCYYLQLQCPPADSLPLFSPAAAAVANMYIIPMGMALGAKITVSEFLLNNLIPVTVSSLV